MNTTTIGYTRVSTLAQVDGEGLGVQREKIESWCRYQGLHLDGMEVDAAVSGSAENRPGFRKAIRRVLDAAPDSTLVVYKLDRLGRNAVDVQSNLEVLLDAGVRVVSIVDGVDSASGMGAAVLKLLTSILAAFAEMEKETIRQRLLDGRRRADRENRKYASEPRYGRRMADDGRTLVDEPIEQAVVDRVRQLRESGLTYRAICRALEEEGHRPRRAASWSATVVRRIATGKRAPKKSAASTRIERLRAELLAPEQVGQRAEQPK